MDMIWRTKEELNLGSVQVSWMLHCARVVAVVSVFDHRLKELSKHLMRNKKTFSDPVSPV